MNMTHEMEFIPTGERIIVSISGDAKLVEDIFEYLNDAEIVEVDDLDE